jgi:hypothetical protein
MVWIGKESAMKVLSTCLLDGLGAELHEWNPAVFPMTWAGFNLSMVPFSDKANYFLCVVRLHMNMEMISQDKVVPGVRTLMPHNRPHDKSTHFIWQWWKGYEYSVVFGATFRPATSGFVVDKTVKPFTLNSYPSLIQKPCACPKGVDPMTRLSASDYRLVKINGDVFIHDTYTTFLWKMFGQGGRITMQRTHDGICRLPNAPDPVEEVVAGGGRNKKKNREKNKRPQEAQAVAPVAKPKPVVMTMAGMEAISNPVAPGAPYYKYFDKNWGYVGVRPDGRLLFLDWFYEDGVYGVLMNRETLECERIRLCANPVLPKEATATLPAFSFGSTHLSLKRSNARPDSGLDVIGVGHAKLKWEQLIASSAPLHKDAMKIDAECIRRFGKMYKRHSSYVYMLFFYRLAETAPGVFSMTMSDLWIPIIDNAAIYHSLVVFPMSVVSGGGDAVHVTMGMSDMYNAIITFSKAGILDSLKHDVSSMTASKLRFTMLVV